MPKASTKQRGYSGRHARLRREWSWKVQRGNVRCAYCGDLIRPGSPGIWATPTIAPTGRAQSTLPATGPRRAASTTGTRPSGRRRPSAARFAGRRLNTAATAALRRIAAVAARSELSGNGGVSSPLSPRESTFRPLSPTPRRSQSSAASHTRATGRATSRLREEASGRPKSSRKRHPRQRVPQLTPVMGERARRLR